MNDFHILILNIRNNKNVIVLEENNWMVFSLRLLPHVSLTESSQLFLQYFYCMCVGGRNDIRRPFRSSEQWEVHLYSQFWAALIDLQKTLLVIREQGLHCRKKAEDWKISVRVDCSTVATLANTSCTNGTSILFNEHFGWY